MASEVFTSDSTSLSNFRPEGSKFKFVSTIDIDNAYCYLEKGLARTIGAFVVHFGKEKKMK